MEQGCRVNKLDAGGQCLMAPAAIAAHAARGQGEHGAQPLAAGGDEMTGELRDQRHGTVHILQDQSVDDVQILGHQALQLVQRGFASACTFIF